MSEHGHVKPWLPPDVMGHMASMSGTDQPLEVCNSCLRAHLYGALTAASIVGGNLSRLTGMTEPDAAQNLPLVLDLLRETEEAATATISVLLDIVKVDFAGQVDTEGWSTEDWRIAMSAFYRGRSEHYVDLETGEIKFEPHDPETGAPINDSAMERLADNDDGPVTA